MKKIRLLLALILLIFSTTVQAEEIQTINKGEPAPYTGILFPTKRVEMIRKELIEKDQLEILFKSEAKKNINLTEIVKLKESEVDLYKKQNNRLLKLEENNSKMKYVWFGLGVLATGFAVYGAGSLAK